MTNLTAKSEDAAAMLAMLANAHRLRILCELHQGEKSVSQLEDVIGLSQSALSQHLAKLRAAGIVKTRRDAQVIFYAILDERAARILGTLFDVFCGPPTRTRSTPTRTTKTRKS